MFYVYVFVLVGVVALGFPRSRWYMGESWVRFFLRKLDAEKYIVMHDIRLPNPDGHLVRLDHIILSSYGIFVIGTKNYHGWIYGKEDSPYWTHVIFHRKEMLYNPILQNENHIKSILHLVGSNYADKFISITCFNSKSTLRKIKVHSKRVHVINEQNILKLIQKYKKEIIPHEQLVEIESYILKNLVTHKEAKKGHTKTIQSVGKNVRTKIQAQICQKCGKELNNLNENLELLTECDNHPKCHFLLKRYPHDF